MFQGWAFWQIQASCPLHCNDCILPRSGKFGPSLCGDNLWNAGIFGSKYLECLCVCLYFVSKLWGTESPQRVKVLIISFFDPVPCRNLRVEIRVENQPSPQRDSALLSWCRLREFWNMYFHFSESKWMPWRVGFEDGISWRVGPTPLLSSVHWLFAWLGGFSENSFHSLRVLANCETTGLSSDWKGEGDLRGCLSYSCGKPREVSILAVFCPRTPHIYHTHQYLLSWCNAFCSFSC